MSPELSPETLLARAERRCYRRALRRIDDLQGTIDFLWHHFIAPMWGELRVLAGAMERAGIVVDSRPATKEDLVRKHTQAILAQFGGNKTRSARALGINVKTLYNWLHRWEEQARTRVGA